MEERGCATPPRDIYIYMCVCVCVCVCVSKCMSCPQSHCGDNRKGKSFSCLHKNYARLPSVRSEHSVFRGSFMTTFTFLLAAVHSCLWINSILNSNRSIETSMYLSTLTGYLLHTHAMMLGLTLSFCKLFRIILFSYHIRLKFSVYSNKLRYCLTGKVVNMDILTVKTCDIYVSINKLYVLRVD